MTKLFNHKVTIKIDDFNFKGRKAIIRVDFNVPLNKETGEVSDDTRIRGALPTIKKVIADGGAAILMSYMGKPKNVNPQEGDPKFSLKQIIPAIEKYLGKISSLLAHSCCEPPTLSP